MRMGLSNRTKKTEQTRNQVKPQREAIWKPRPKRKGVEKPTKGKKEERKRQKLKKLRTKPQMRTQTIQAIRWSRGVAQLLWIEKPKMPTHPCRKQMEMHK
jgi:hypothetical protein